MKSSEFKKIIKESVREVFQEEIKEILLESVKSSNTIQETTSSTPQPQTTQQPNTQSQNTQPQLTESEKRKKYDEILSSTSGHFTTNNIKPKFQPQPQTDTINGQLPEGELGMDQINNLLNKNG